MIFHRISLIIAKYVAISLCVLAVLFTNPWGTQLTLVLLNNIDAIEVDYHSGSFVRDIELNSFHLQLKQLDISIKGLATELDFSCLWKKTLCLKASKADEFTLRYTSEDKSPSQNEVQATVQQLLFTMPFAIKTDLITLKQSHLFINSTEIAITELSAQLNIRKSTFDIFQPTANKLAVIIAESLDTKNAQDKDNYNEIHSPFSQLPAVNLPIALAIKQLHVNDITVATKNSHHALKQHWHSTNNRLTGSWVNTDIGISQFQTTTSAFTIEQLSGSAKLQPPYQVNSQIISQLVTVPWWPELASSRQQISLQGSFANLAFTLINQGNLTLTSQGNVNLSDKDMPFNITLTAEKIPLPVSLAQYGDPLPVSLQLAGDLQAQTIKLTSQLRNNDYKNAQITLDAAHQQGHFIINDFIFNDADSNSQLNLQANIELNSADTRWQVTAESSGFSLPQLNIQSLKDLAVNQKSLQPWINRIPNSITGYLQGKVNSSGSWSAKQWQLTVSDTAVTGKINDSKVELNADFSLNPLGHWQAGKLLLAFNNNKLTINTTGDSFWGIKGQLSIAQISQWLNGVSGAVMSDFSITGEQDNPIIQLDSQFTQLNWRNWHSNVLAIKGNYQPMMNHHLQLSLHNDALTFANDNSVIQVNDFQLQVNGDASQHQINTQWRGDFTGQFALTGQWDDTFSHWQTTITKSELSYKNIVVQNNKAFALNLDVANQQIKLASHCWQGSGLSVCLPNQAVLGDTGDIAVNLHIDLATIDELFLPEHVELISEINGELSAKWSAQQSISAKAWFALSNGHLKVSDDLGEHQLSQWSKGKLSFAIDKLQFTSKLQLFESEENALLDFDSTIDFMDDYPINTQISVKQFNLQPLQTILADVVNLHGNLSADIAVTGALNSPIFNGYLALADGKLQLIQNANTLDNITSKLTINNNHADLLGVFSLDNKVANFNGNISWQESLAMDIDLNGDALPLVFPPQLAITISPSLHVNVVEKVLTISGNIDVLDGHYNIEKLPQDSVSLSDDVIIIDQLGQPAAKATKFEIKTDISVNIAKAFEITGQGLQSHLFGQLHINQKQHQPLQLFGKIESDKGTFQAYGQRLTIEKGAITFNGPINNPYFNLTAKRHIKSEDIDVGINITGLADELNLQLFSSPTMEMPEMLSYLVRGRSLDAGAENSTIAASLLIGFGVTNSVGLFKQIEKIPLLSNIAVDTEGEGDQTQATVSGYIGNRVYLKYGIGVYEPINELTVRMFMFNRFWLEIVSGIEHSTDIYYSFDID